MEDISAMVKGSSTSEFTSVDQIDQIKSKEFLSKSILCYFYEISKEEHLKKVDNQTQSLIIKFSKPIRKG